MSEENERHNRRVGAFVISLDFELMWGCVDHKSLHDYGAEVEGVWDVVPKMLAIFEEHEIHATWGVVGLVARNNIEECIENQPEILPTYNNKILSTYNHYERIRDWDNKYLFAKELLREIQGTPFQEIGAHTYSHYYCAEEGQTEEAFKADLQMARIVLGEYTENLRTLILPRNQVNIKYSPVLKKCGFTNYRGTERIWFYEPVVQKTYNQLIRRLLRLADCYVGVFGAHCYKYSEIKDDNGLNNVRSSRFFRPFSRKMAYLEPLRLHRIKDQMKYAAKHGQVFHLWWHPHNFGVNIEQNLKNLCDVIAHYEMLKRTYGMKSLNMGELGRMVS